MQRVCQEMKTRAHLLHYNEPGFFVRNKMTHTHTHTLTHTHTHTHTQVFIVSLGGTVCACRGRDLHWCQFSPTLGLITEIIERRAESQVNQRGQVERQE